MNWRTFAGIASVSVVVLGYQVLRPEPVYSKHVPITTKIVFNREIASIFQRKCFQCHTADNISVPLTTYKDARPWAVAIKEEILERRMVEDVRKADFVVVNPDHLAIAMRYDPKGEGAPVVVAKGEPCLGPVTRTGCGALCPGMDRGCYGCFGPAQAPGNTRALGRRFIELGLSSREAADRYRFITG